MSKTVVVSVAVVTTQFPAGTVAGAYRFNLTSSTGVMTQDLAEPVATFADVPAGSYTATVQRLDAAGSPLGAALSQSVEVPADIPATVGVDIPATLTVTFA